VTGRRGRASRVWAGNVLGADDTMVAKLANKYVGSGAVVADRAHDRLREVAATQRTLR
jgi:hypothetical protein